MNTKSNYLFPFGESLKKVKQTDTSPKKVFVLGVYASAVHASWVDSAGKRKVSALAVASEPEIFWRGENADEIISKIHIPERLGKLTVPKNKALNGPSGRALDNLFLKPLGFERLDVWLCDLLPESRVNEKQRKAIDAHYTLEVINEYDLPQANIPDFNKSELNSKNRREEILNELKLSKAETLILLGDLPIYWFLRFYVEKKFNKLSEFGVTTETYGIPKELKVEGTAYNVIALCHPRQADRLGSSSSKWGVLHDNWANK